MNAIDDLYAKLRIVNERLQQISDLTGKMALAGTAQPGYPPYDALSRELDRMLDVSNALLMKLRDATSP
ncbi:hypothetical protein ACI2UY_22615 [Ralstonia nicotianae]